MTNIQDPTTIDMLRDINEHVDYFGTVKELTIQQLKETSPAKYAAQTAGSLAFQALVIKLTRNRFPRFSKGYTIWCAVVQVLSLGLYVRVQTKKEANGVLTYEHEYVYGEMEVAMRREWMITHGLCPDCGDRRDSITGCPKHG